MPATATMNIPSSSANTIGAGPPLPVGASTTGDDAGVGVGVGVVFSVHVTLAAFDVTSTEPRMGVISPMRPACQDGVVTAHGYLFWGPWMCRCDMTQLGVISLGPAGSFDYTAEASEKTGVDRA